MVGCKNCQQKNPCLKWPRYFLWILSIYFDSFFFYNERLNPYSLSIFENISLKDSAIRYVFLRVEVYSMLSNRLTNFYSVSILKKVIKYIYNKHTYPSYILQAVYNPYIFQISRVWGNEPRRYSMFDVKLSFVKKNITYLWNASQFPLSLIRHFFFVPTGQTAWPTWSDFLSNV